MDVLTVALQCKVDDTTGRECQVNRADDNVTVTRTIWGGASVPRQEKTHKYVLLMTMFKANSDAEFNKRHLRSKHVS
jgi:hypothetical protein